MTDNLKSIEIVFSQGSFEEWVEQNVTENPEVETWMDRYHGWIKEKLEASYPGATVEVGEGYEQLASTKVFVEYHQQDEDSWLREDGDKDVIHSIIADAADHLDVFCA